MYIIETDREIILTKDHQYWDEDFMEWRDTECVGKSINDVGNHFKYRRKIKIMSVSEDGAFIES